MTLEEAKVLLGENNIPFALREFRNEEEYRRHTTLFPDTKDARSCRVMALIVPSQNGKKNIELQFNAAGEDLCLEELWFGDYSFELFDMNIGEEKLAGELLRHIEEIMCGRWAVIVSYDLKKKCGMNDWCFDMNDAQDDMFGVPGFRQVVEWVEEPRGFFAKLLGWKRQYEIYDWNTYRCVVR